MPSPVSDSSGKYDNVASCVEKARLICGERGVKFLSPEKLTKIETRCTDLVKRFNTWNLPTDKVSKVIDDLCAPGSGSGKGGMMPVEIRGTDPDKVPSGSSSMRVMDFIKGSAVSVGSSLGKFWKDFDPTALIPLAPSEVSQRVLKIYGTGENSIDPISGLNFVDVGILSLKVSITPTWVPTTMPMVVPKPISAPVLRPMLVPVP